MLSVLIPVYNYSIVSLVNELQRQLTEQQLEFEIICLEDGSNEKFVQSNIEIEKQPFTTLIISRINHGSIKARQLLSENAKYDWLLFLDADVMPKDRNFIANYIPTTNKSYEAVFGGFAYKQVLPDPNYMLRWKYGKQKEEVKASIRNRQPYKIIISANYLIRKSTFEVLHSVITETGYGLDNYFGALLKSKRVSVLHIDNEVFHLGIEKSDVYLNKKKRAAEMLLRLYKANKIANHDNDLLKLFEIINRFGLNRLFSSFYIRFNTKLKRNLLGKTPNISLLQLYRISYMCHADLNTK